MSHRLLILSLAACLAGLAGCTGPEPADEDVSDVPAAPVEEVYFENDELQGLPALLRDELRVVAVNYNQLTKLMLRDDLPLRAVEAKGWLIAEKSGRLIETIRHQKREKIEAGLLRELIIDLDLVALNSKRLALEAANWNEKDVRKNFTNLQKAAKRCLPRVVYRAPKPPATGPDGEVLPEGETPPDDETVPDEGAEKAPAGEEKGEGSPETAEKEPPDATE